MNEGAREVSVMVHHELLAERQLLYAHRKTQLALTERRQSWTRLNGDNSVRPRIENIAITAHLETRHIADDFRHSTERPARTFLWNKGCSVLSHSVVSNSSESP